MPLLLQVFEEGPLSGEPHPLNKKAKCRVYLRDLQQEVGLSDAALQHIALICGPRSPFSHCPSSLPLRHNVWGPRLARSVALSALSPFYPMQTHKQVN